MEKSNEDLWSEWIDHRQYSDDRGNQRQANMLRRFQTQVLEGAKLESDDTVLDVGTGDGLVGFGAIERIGEDGTVIFNDISPSLLMDARSLAGALEVQKQCRFLCAPAQDLGSVASESVDVVTARSVLIYLDKSDKEQAISEFHRILKPGGRLSILEPAHTFWSDLDITRQTCLGYDIESIADIAGKVNRTLSVPSEWDLWIDFDAQDLFALGMKAGFKDVEAELSAQRHIVTQSEDWEMYLNSTPNPLARTLREAMEEALTSEERQRFTEHLKQKVESETESREILDAMVALRTVKKQIIRG